MCYKYGYNNVNKDFMEIKYKQYIAYKKDFSFESDTSDTLLIHVYPCEKITINLLELLGCLNLFSKEMLTTNHRYVIIKTDSGNH